MKNWKKAVSKYNLESRNLDNFDGSVRGKFVGSTNSFIGQTNNADGQGMGGDIFSHLDDSNKFYTIAIENTQTSGAAVTAIVFGANQYPGTTAQPNAGVTVTVAESSHAEARAASQTEPFWVNGLRYLVETTSQMNTQVITIRKRTSNGEGQTKIFRPLSFRTSYQNQSLQIDAPGYKFLVDGNTSIEVPVVADETVTLILQLGGRFNSANAVEGKSAIEVASQRELATGLVQVVK